MSFERGAITVADESRLPAKVTRQPPVTINTLLTKDEFVRLVAHMANDNPISHFLVAWTDGDGKPRYSKADPHRRVRVHAGWTYDTITGKAKLRTSMGLYPKNKANESTWGALAFDAHEHGHDELAKNRAIRAFMLMLEYRDRYLILSASGRGYHVFILANESRPVAEWTNLLKDTCESIDAPIQDGVCECFLTMGQQISQSGAQSAFPDRSTRPLAKSNSSWLTQSGHYLTIWRDKKNRNTVPLLQVTRQALGNL
jgi:hypothetical protein